mgnify:CR=1 FL=1
MTWHIIQGSEGCSYAVEHGAVAIVVDALRASATAAMLLDAGVTDIIAVTEVAEAFAAQREFPDALLFGERGGLPPEGFDYGNSPQTVGVAAGRKVIFTTTTGAGRLVACWGAHALYMGTTVNAAAVAHAAAAHGTDVVLIPAGLSTDPSFSAQEDWVAACVIAQRAGYSIGVGNEAFDYWTQRMETEGVAALFASAPHADKLRAVGLESDIAYCAQEDLTDAVPRAVACNEYGVHVQQRK